MADVPLLGPSSKLRGKIEMQTQSHIMKMADRINRVAAKDETAPVAEVLTEVFDKPDEVWPVAKVRTVVLSLYKDYLRMLLPYLDEATHTIAADAPTDEELRERLLRSSTTYATLAKAHQHANWFKFFTDRTRSKADREEAAGLLELRVAVETGRLSEAEATAQLSHTRAGVLAKARALENLDALKAAGTAPSKQQIRDARASIAALKKAEKAEKAEEPRRRGKGTRGIPPARLAELRAAADATAPKK